jgi:hypothetical protein
MATEFRPGVVLRIPFSIIDVDGGNVGGLTWSVELLTKDGAEITSGVEYDSISVADIGTVGYEVRFTPDADSLSTYVLKVVSDGDPVDVFEEILSPDWGWIFLAAKMVRDRGATPETVDIQTPGGTSVIKFKMYRSGNNEIREEDS